MLRLIALMLALPATLFAQTGGGGTGAPGGGGATTPTAAGWVEVTSTAAWSTRVAHTAVTLNNRLWVIGGAHGATNLNDVWSSSDGVAWTQETAAAPWSARISHASVAFNNRLWVMGGLDAPFSPKNDVWSSADGVQWTLETAAAGWSPRMCHAAAVFNGLIWVMGGSADKNDVWSSPDGVTWTQETAHAAWLGRVNLSVEVFQNRMWVLGGVINATVTRLDDVWSSSDGVNWTQSSTGLHWSPRTGQRTAVYAGRLWVFGGEDQYYSYAYTPFTNDVWSTTDGASWTWEATSAGWKQRERHAAAVFDNRIWVLGGNAYGGLSNSVWTYEETAPQITSTPPVSATPGTLYSYDIAASGFPLPVIGASGLPAWLSLSGSTLSGIPATTEVGTTSAISVTASNTQGTDIQNFQIDVLGPPQIVSTPATHVTVGDLYAYTVVATGGPVPVLSVGALPAWLSFDAQTGTLQGTPGVPHIDTVATIDILASNGIGPDAVQTFSIHVDAALSNGGSGAGGAVGCAAGVGSLPVLLALFGLIAAARRKGA